MNKTAAELEREAEIARARVADTAESIRNKMTPGQLLDEVRDAFAGNDGARMLANLKTQVRDNPLPLTMIGTGLAWLMLGGGAGSGNTPTSRPNPTSGYTNDFAERSDQVGGDGFGTGSPVEHGGDVGTAIKDTADTISSMARGAAEAVAGVTTDAKEGLAKTAGLFGSTASDMTSRTTQSAKDLFEREPLALAAVGLAIGTAIGVMLPHTAMEDEQLGGYSDKLRDKAENVVEAGMEQAKEVAATAYETVKEEVNREGSTSETGSIVDQVGEVVKATAAKTEETIRDRLAGSDQIYRDS